MRPSETVVGKAAGQKGSELYLKQYSENVFVRERSPRLLQLAGIEAW